MKIIRHTARDMRQAMRAVREQLGEDAVILSSRRTSEGVEVTAAVDFDASTLEAGGFAAPPDTPAAAPISAPVSSPARSRGAAPVATNSTALALPTTRAIKPNQSAPEPTIVPDAIFEDASGPALSYEEAAAYEQGVAYQPPQVHQQPQGLQPRLHQAPAHQPQAYETQAYQSPPPHERRYAYEPEWISPAARQAVVEHAQELTQQQRAGRPRTSGDAQSAAPSAHQAAARQTATMQTAALAPDTALASAAALARAASVANAAPTLSAPTLSAIDEPVIIPDTFPTRTDVPVFRGAAGDAVEQAREAALAPFGTPEPSRLAVDLQSPAAQAATAADAMGSELKTLRRMLENQLAHLAWNDLARRAPIHTEMLRELTEIGITPDLAEHLVRQLPEDTDLTFARRFTIAGLSQYLRVTGDRWLDDGGRVAFVGSTGVGKTTTLAKIAVRWVLRHGARDLALVAGDSVRMGAQEQMRSLAQLLGVPVYTPDSFEKLPSLLESLHERLILIDTPGTSARETHLGARLAVLANSASRLETALVLAASTQAGAIDEAVRYYTPANPSCCVLTKLDEAASLGSVLSILIRARLPVSYVSEGQRVPEDLRPARALELVSAAVRLAKAKGAAADEDLLRRRFGKTAHGIT
jgi:flagellar biosynthesis protein FlhF